MNKNPINILRKEHDKVLRILDKLEKSTENKNAKSIADNIMVLEKEFNRHSLNKEEKALFPEIEKFIPSKSGPTEMMRMEHKELVVLIKDFKENLKNKNFKKLNGIENSILSLLRPHIDKENNILFMMAEMHLNNKQKKTILEKFKEFDLKKED